MQFGDEDDDDDVLRDEDRVCIVTERFWILWGKKNEKEMFAM